MSAPECYERLGSYAQMNPPIRDEQHRQALWQAVNDGVIDVIGSDHAPHTREEKDKTYPDTPSGMPGVQTLVTLLLDHVNKGSMSLERFVDLTASGPQRIFGLAGKGRVALGYDADFTIVDLGLSRKIENKWIASRCGWTPFDGMTTKGWAVASVLGGQIVMRDFALTGKATGKPLGSSRRLSRQASAVLTAWRKFLRSTFLPRPPMDYHRSDIRRRHHGPDRGGADRTGQSHLHPRSFAFGPLNGFVSGLGAALGDGVFAAITFFGLTWIAQLIQSYDPIIEVMGGALLVWFGVHTVLSPMAGKVDDGDKNDAGASTLVRAMVSTFVLTITNPATLIAFASMFASFHGLVGGANSYVDAEFVVAGVVGGSAGWWLA